jgi:mannosyltransferase
VNRRWLLVIVLVAFALRAWRLDGQELRGDEAFGYFFSLRPYGEIIEATLALQEPHPVASYFVQRAWLGWAGDHEFALRFPSLWFGVLAVALLGGLGRRLALPPVAPLIAAGLLAISPYAIWHSQDARMYSMSLALTLASSWLAVEWLQRRRWPWSLSYLLVTWLALHTHYYAAFVVLAQTLFVASRGLLLRRLWNTLASWISLQLLLGLLYLPWLLPASALLTGYGGNGDSPALGAALGRAVGVFAIGESASPDQRMIAALLAGLLLAIGVVRLLNQGEGGRRAAWLLVLYLAVPLLATWWSAQSRPIFNERYLIAAAPPFYLLLATGCTLIWPSTRGPNWSRVGLSLAVAGVTLFLLITMTRSLQHHFTDPRYSKDRGWRALAATITRWSAQLPPETVRVAQNFPDPTLWYYYRGPLPRLVLPPAPADEAGAAAAVADLAADGVQRVILPIQPASNWDEEAIAAAALEQHYALATTQQVGVWPVALYVLPPTQLAPVSAQFQNGIALTGAAWQPTSLTPGAPLIVHLAWLAEDVVVTGTEKVFVQVLNEAGVLVAQDDRPLAAALSTLGNPALYTPMLPEPLPPGVYRLITGLYDPAQPGAPRILTTTGADHVLLGELATAP